MIRYCGQHGRKAVGPGRKASKAQVAQYIVESIAAHAPRGGQRLVGEYTPDTETQALVTALLQQQAAA